MGSSRRDQVALEKKKWEAEQQKERMGGRWVGNASGGFRTRSELEADRVNQQTTGMQSLQNKGALDQVKYRQDAASERAANQLGFDKTKYQQDFGETRRTGDRNFGQASLEQNRRFGQDVAESDQDFWQKQQQFKQSKLDQDRRFNTDVFNTKYKNEAEKKKAWEAEINTLVYGQTDKDGFLIPGTGGMSYKDALATMKHRERFYNENIANQKGMPAAGQDIYQSQNGAFTNVPTQTGVENYTAQPPVAGVPQQPYQYPTGANMQGMGQFGNQQQGGVSPAMEAGLQSVGRGINKTLDFASRVSNANSAANKLKAFQQLQGALHSNRWDR